MRTGDKVPRMRRPRDNRKVAELVALPGAYTLVLANSNGMVQVREDLGVYRFAPEHFRDEKPGGWTYIYRLKRLEGTSYAIYAYVTRSCKLSHPSRLQRQQKRKTRDTRRLKDYFKAMKQERAEQQAGKYQEFRQASAEADLGHRLHERRERTGGHPSTRPNLGPPTPPASPEPEAPDWFTPPPPPPEE